MACRDTTLALSYVHITACSSVNTRALQAIVILNIRFGRSDSDQSWYCSYTWILSLGSHEKAHETDVTQAGGTATAHKEGFSSGRLQGGLHLGDVLINLRMRLKLTWNTGDGCKLNQSGSECGPTEGSCESGYELSRYTRVGNFYTGRIPRASEEGFPSMETFRAE